MVLERADRDLASLTVLALLVTGPRHPYEMHRMVIDYHKDFVTGLPRSIYHAVEKLRRLDLVAVDGTESAAGRPERTRYRLTASGRTVLAERVRRLLATPDSDADLLVAALSYVGCLTEEEAVAALDERVATLAARIEAAAAEVAAARPDVPRFLLVDAEFALARLRAEREWVAALAADVAAGTLSWPADLREVPSTS